METILPDDGSETQQVEDETLREQTLSFVTQVVKLPCEEFLGVARILCVPITVTCAQAIETSDKVQIRELEEVFSDMIDRFVQLKREQRGELLFVVFEATKKSKKEKKKK